MKNKIIPLNVAFVSIPSIALLIAIIAAWKAASSTGNSSAKIPRKYQKVLY